MKVLVTGGTGFIGSHTVVELQAGGHSVWIADNLSNSSSAVIDGIEAISGLRPAFSQTDLSDLEALRTLFRNEGPFDGVIHFAAFKAVGESILHPLKYYCNNLGSTANLLNCMLESECRNLVFSSSCTVYGMPDQLPVNEEAPVKPALSPYGNTKQISEEIIFDTAATCELNAQILRYFNPIGAHHSALIGELPLGTPNNLIPYMTQTAIGKREVLSVYGNDYPTKDGTCLRDYIHVVDLAKAHIIALERMQQAKNETPLEVFNLGTGRPYSVLEVIQTFEAASGQKLNYRISPRRAGDVPAVWADTRKANELLGWKAEAGLEEMVQSAWKWELEMHKNHQK